MEERKNKQPKGKQVVLFIGNISQAFADVVFFSRDGDPVPKAIQHGGSSKSGRGAGVPGFSSRRWRRRQRRRCRRQRADRQRQFRVVAGTAAPQRLLDVDSAASSDMTFEIDSRLRVMKITGISR